MPVCDKSPKMAFHDLGGRKHIWSVRTKAHLLGIEWLRQTFGFECRHPKVCRSEFVAESASLVDFHFGAMPNRERAGSLGNYVSRKSTTASVAPSQRSCGPE